MTAHKGLPHDTVAHRWAQNTPGDHAAGFNMWFEGDTIYSYGMHFPIARHVENPRGEKAVLFTTDSYGPSTAKHCCITRRACGHITNFDVPLIRDNLGLDMHAANMKHFQAEYDAAIEGAERVTAASSYNTADQAIGRAEAIEQAGNDYARFFAVDAVVVPAFKIHLDWLRARYARLTSPEATAERERKAERRRELEAVRHQGEIERYCAGEIHGHSLDNKAAQLLTQDQINRRQAFEALHYAGDVERWANGADLPRYFHLGYDTPATTAPDLIASRARDLANPEQIERRRLHDAEKHKEAIAEWRAGGSVRLGSGSDVAVMLRVNPHNAIEIETSWGARFPAAQAQEALRYIQAVRRRGETWHANGEQAPALGYYKIDKITGAGDVRAGCHLVPWREIETLALELGWIERPSDNIVPIV